MRLAVRWSLPLFPAGLAAEAALLGLARISVAGLLALAVAAGVGEEALFRGLLQTALGERLGPVAAVGLVGALFGAAHAISIAYGVMATALGLYLGAAFALTGQPPHPADRARRV